MKFEWDTQKSDMCFTQRGFDFAYVTQAFLDPNRCIRRDTRHDYGEIRYILLGKITGRIFCVAYTPRKTNIRIISARKANAREVRYYDNYLHE